MAIKSVFSNGGSGMTRGGLDRYLGPEAGSYSEMPEAIENPEGTVESPQVMNCEGANADQAVCQIAKAEAEKAAEENKTL